MQGTSIEQLIYFKKEIIVAIWQLSEPDADIMLYVFNHISILTVVIN